MYTLVPWPVPALLQHATLKAGGGVGTRLLTYSAYMYTDGSYTCTHTRMKRVHENNALPY